MPEQIRCPSCDATLRVPDNLLGKNVKCPKCATTFIAEVEELAQPEGIIRERTPEASAAREMRGRDDYDDEPPPDYDDEDRLRARRRRRRGEAAAMVSGPAIALMVSAGLGIASNIVYAIFQLLSVGVNSPGPRRSDAGFVLGYSLGAGMVVCGPTLPGIIMSFIVWAGAIKMKRLQGFGLAMTACILAMMPCNCCFVLGLGFGIWGLVVLNNPAVREAFS
jgi:predicted Zn finger-like uncharacterized protein